MTGWLDSLINGVLDGLMVGNLVHLIVGCCIIESLDIVMSVYPVMQLDIPPNWS